MAIKYSQLSDKLPRLEKTAVIALVSGQPPTIDTEKTIKVVNFLAKQHKAESYIFISNTHDTEFNPLHIEKKLYWLKRFFPKSNFITIENNTDKQSQLTTAANICHNSGVKNLIVVISQRHAMVFQNLLKAYNNSDLFRFKSWKVISSGEDSINDDKVIHLATKNDIEEFKKYLPGDCTVTDAKRLMNDIRQGLGTTKLIESLSLTINPQRDKYYKGEIFNIGEQVMDKDGWLAKIVDRRTNYVVCEDEKGIQKKKFVWEIKEVK
jgi:hypothetical protein